MKTSRIRWTVVGVLALAACDAPAPDPHVEEAASDPGRVVTVRAASVDALLHAAGVAEPYAEATLGTKLMGTVMEVRVREGDAVAEGQPLVVIDARDLAAKMAQVDARIAEADAMRREALTHAERMRALYAEQAAPKAQLDQAETGLARADAAFVAAQAGAAELRAVSAYAVVRAPFAGVVVARMVDPGAFAAPGVPLLTVQDSRRLRVTVTASPDAVRSVARGATLAATIERAPAVATVEGVVPLGGGSVYAVNAIVDNATGAHLPGSAAVLSLPQGSRSAILIPSSALLLDGDLTGVRVRGADGDELRWVRLGRAHEDEIEVLSGLRVGEQVVIPVAHATAVASGR